MSNTTPRKRNIGDLQPSHLLHSFGVGAIVELPNLSVMVMGLDEWPPQDRREIVESRLLQAVREKLGPQVDHLYTPPIPPDTGQPVDPYDDSNDVGVPVAPFPRWLLCPSCRLLAPINSDLFELKVERIRKDRSRYIHRHCSKPSKRWAVPARFLVACEHGHLDDFPWVEFVHRGRTDCRSELRLYELGASGEVADIEVRCMTCDVPPRRMADAFTKESKDELPKCRGRWPHLRSWADDGCGEPVTSILLGASNSWFPLTMSALSIPQNVDRLGQLVEQNWGLLQNATSLEVVAAFANSGLLHAFTGRSNNEVWAAVQARAGETEDDANRSEGLRDPEWRAFSSPDPDLNGRDFRLREVERPPGYEDLIERVVLAERLREVRSLIGFTRIESPGDLSEPDELPDENRAPLARTAPVWVPSMEVRGEGLFIQLSEPAIEAWLSRVTDLDVEFRDAHRHWRKLRKLDPDVGYPGMRYVLLHSLSHCLMRQLSLQCGYTAASIRERIYSRGPGQGGEPMAGVLIYTAAADSEGTLGGLVSLGEPEVLARHLAQSLEGVSLCPADPLCAEHQPAGDALALHGAACHACLFAPETSCERGNKYLDRGVLTETVERGDFAFFGGQ